MTIAVLQEPIFTDEIKAREWLEGRVWAGWSGLPALRLGPRARDQARRLEGRDDRLRLHRRRQGPAE